MGSTPSPSCALWEGQDHPHIHGEHDRLELSQGRVEGSPPYTWGAQLEWAFRKIQEGITPIYMGSTRKGRCSVKWCKDHPHIHGEHDDYQT